LRNPARLDKRIVHGKKKGKAVDGGRRKSDWKLKISMKRSFQTPIRKNAEQQIQKGKRPAKGKIKIWKTDASWAQGTERGIKRGIRASLGNKR